MVRWRAYSIAQQKVFACIREVQRYYQRALAASYRQLSGLAEPAVVIRPHAGESDRPRSVVVRPCQYSKLGSAYKVL